ncbi:peptidase associated/transthyretin-like domain-containing protein [Faecalibacter rhinopitheci]|uniref:Carboxypeptidase regulatory-like domain-containing protein n=1 Tax=Faecalibacter rhinopitheci TaxID=2779678 RepID=A0A8J7FLU7_9FLAO|nr:hypothetical protein [Faecalibacter rhinopitheci]MBF0596460.1 hypothetical protein [Faecalibacter rhinopitheci]
MKKILLLIFLFGFSYWMNAQYIEPEKSVKEAEKKKQSEIITLPKSKFDSVVAKNMLAIGKSKITGVAFTRARESKNFNMKTGNKVNANQMKITLYPVTPYFQEFYKLYKDKTKHNPKKNMFVEMERDAYRYRLEAITNSDGEFTFPDMKPGKYYMFGVLDYVTTYNSHQYTGSGYDGYGRIDYYSPYSYQKNDSELLELFVEIKQDGEILKVKLK